MLLVLILILSAASMTYSGDNPDVAIALHVVDYCEPCDGLELPDCWSIVTNYPTEGHICVYVLVCGHGWTGQGFTGVWYGLTWPADWLWISWTDCSDWWVGAIAGPGDWVEQHWNTCQPPAGYPEVAGILELNATSAGMVEVVAHSGRGTAGVDDCFGGFDLVLPCDLGNGRAGWVGIGAVGAGCNPCPCVGPPCHTSPSSSDRTTWGNIKSLFD
jgi:hypothetical protein